MENDLRILRDRHRDLEDRIGRLPPDPDGGSRSLLVQTVSAGSYPTAGGVFYAVVEVEASGTELEGATPTFTAVSDVFDAINLGTQVPPVGTVLIVCNVGGKWAFRYDG